MRGLVVIIVILLFVVFDWEADWLNDELYKIGLT